MKKNGSIVTVLFIVAIIIASVVYIVKYMSRPQQIILQGEAVAQSYKVSSKLVGRIDSLAVKLGDNVEKGDFLFRLSTPEVYAKMQQAQAMLSAAGAQNQMAIKGLRPEEIEAIRSMHEKAVVGLELAEATFKRVRTLYNEGVLPAQKFDEALANVKSMNTNVTATQAQYDMAVQGARAGTKRAAAAVVEKAQGGVAEVRSYLNDATQYSQINGEVSSVIAEEGELVNAGYPVVSIVDLSDIWFSFNVKESFLPMIRESQTISVNVPALAKSIKVKVYYIAVQAQYATWTATRADGEFDIRTFEVRMRPVDAQIGLRPGMTALINWSSI